MSIRVIAVVSALTLSLGAGAVARQTAPPPQQAPVFRGGVNVVPLTVSVFDRNGLPVTDLKPSDFTIIENDKPREILNFFTQAFTPQPPPAVAAAAPPALNRAQPNVVTPDTRRVFLIALDFGRIQYPTKALDGAIGFVRDKLLPQDYVAVLGFHRATDFTTDHEKIVAILERYRKGHEEIVHDITEFRMRTSKRESLPEWILAKIDAVFRGPDNQPFRNAVNLLFGVDVVKGLNEKPWDRQEVMVDLASEVGIDYAGLSDAMILASNLKIAAGIEYLRYLEGEKHLVWLGSAVGALRPSSPSGESSVEEERRLARRFNQAQIALDIINTSGVPPANFAPNPQARLTALGNIQWMQGATERTGGSYTGVAMADKALAAIDTRSRFSYLIGYAPSDSALDGKYREVKVIVKRPDVTLRFRHGYYSIAAPDPLDLPDLVKNARIQAAGVFTGEVHDIKIDAQATSLPRIGLFGEVKVSLRIDASRIAFTRSDGVVRGALSLRVYCGDTKEAVLGSAEEELSIKASDEQVAAYLKNGIPYSLRVRVLGTPKFVKVVVFDYGSDLLGMTVLTVK